MVFLPARGHPDHALFRGVLCLARARIGVPPHVPDRRGPPVPSFVQPDNLLRLHRHIDVLGRGIGRRGDPDDLPLVIEQRAAAAAGGYGGGKLDPVLALPGVERADVPDGDRVPQPRRAPDGHHGLGPLVLPVCVHRQRLRLGRLVKLQDGDVL